MNKFEVSVIIPVYNAEPFLECSVLSALRQEEVGEVILVDDGSADKSLQIAEDLAQKHCGRVKFFFHEGHANKGPGSTRNFGVSKATCPFICFLDADDWFLPNCFAFDKAVIEGDPSIDLVRHSLGNAWDSAAEDQAWFAQYAGREKATHKYHSIVENVPPEKYYESLFPIGNTGSGVSGVLTMRRSLFNEVGGFPNRGWAEDAALHLRLAAMGRVAFAEMETPMAMRRIHSDNCSRREMLNLGYRYDSVGLALLETADFLKSRNAPRKQIASLHLGWLKFASKFTSHRSYGFLRKDPAALLNPGVALGYVKFYAAMLMRVADLKTRPMRAKIKARLHGMPVYIWRRKNNEDSPNWGDELNLNFIAELSGRRIRRIGNGELDAMRHCMSIGSTLHLATNKSDVWGTGLISENHFPASMPGRISAVRGPLTRRILLAKGIPCPEIYGDPALLLALFYQPKQPAHGKTVVIPHYMDADLPVVQRLAAQPGTMLLRPDKYEHWLDFVDAIAGASCVISSSLHGLIVAESYKIPSVWVEFSNNVAGGGFKFLDFYASIGQTGAKPVLIDEATALEALKKDAEKWKPGEIDLDKLLLACPFKIRKKSISKNKPE
jgi:Glycosyltransferases involved in cell wall biogenesis